MGDAAFWARRRLGILPRYRQLPPGSAPADARGFGLSLGIAEALIGTYSNSPDFGPPDVTITSTAVAVRHATGWARMPYAAIRTMRYEGGKDNWNTLTLADAHGGELAVHMPGADQKPVCCLATFLTKVSSARPVFDVAAIRAHSAPVRDEWAARVTAGLTPAGPSPVG